MHRQRPATAADKAALERLWLATFPEDTPADVAAFWDSGCSPEQAWVYTVDDEVVSMAFLLPATLSPAEDGLPLPAAYLFAAATHPAWRGQGLFSALIEVMHAYAAGAGLHAVFLRPAEASLRDFYARFGYRDAFYADEYTLTRQEMAALAADNGGEVRALAIPSAARQRWLRDRRMAAAEWPSPVWRYAVNAADGGRYWESSAGWMALCAPDGEHLLVRDLLCDEADLPGVYAHLCREYRFSACTLRRPTTDRQAVFGMLKPLVPATAERLLQQMWYMGPALD